ncbi:MAG: bifunctional glutamate N-acetyltransferase/amino-acid acetyltransferase ArgJ [Nitrospiraceae bacterium]|nr:MAG: bifunctional glutamate N-acetyltransferase/amino-acid acetyltransferase ArgJ [Nitrospiraceae bacterium]
MKRVLSVRKLSVPGFLFAGISAGIKKSGAKDLCLIYSVCPCTAAGLFTTNRIKAAPIRVALEGISSRRAQAIIVNSGNANACTGQKGLADARRMQRLTAEELNIRPELVYVASTGIIGRPMPMGKIAGAIPGLVYKLSPASMAHAASAVMTTDTFRKVALREVRIGRQKGIIAGFAKGAGMIRPNMATMLCFIMTDVSISGRALDSALREAVQASFNSLSVDNDMSTNDAVMIMANGSLVNKRITKKSRHFDAFRHALNDLTYELARMIARDGEGATKLIEVVVRRAPSDHDAARIASAVANSMLVKTALYGRDPNWGRIMAALGYSGADVSEGSVDISINGVRLVRRGVGTGKEESARKALSGRDIVLTIDTGQGTGTARAITCDLTEGYIRINAHYST